MEKMRFLTIYFILFLLTVAMGFLTRAMLVATY